MLDDSKIIADAQNTVNPVNDAIKFSQIINSGKFFEVRMLGTSRGIISGYFDDLEAMKSEIDKWNGSVKGIYATMNSLNPALRDRVDNKLHDHVNDTTKDEDIIEINWIPVDIDPVRQSGISSTQEELDAALSLKDKVKQKLSEQGWPDPVELMSGNGTHLLYPVKLENNKSNRELVKTFLEWLNDKFSNEAIKVDTSVFNPARIIKMPGTLVCKGQYTKERPHRTAKIIQIPKEIREVSAKKLYEIANEHIVSKQPETEQKPNSEFKTLEDFKEWLPLKGVNIVKEKPYKNGILLIPEVCPFNPEHTNRSSYIIWFPNGYIVVGCHHDSCHKNDYYAFRKQIDDEWEPYEKGKNTKASKVLDIISESELFVSQLMEPFVRMSCNGHFENHPLDGDTYKDWLGWEYYKRFGSTIGSDVMGQVISIARSMAKFEGSEKELNVRVSQNGDAFYYDLLDENWRAIKITQDGWEVIDTKDIYFRRYAFMGRQCTPQKGTYGLKKFLDFVNIKNEEERQLLLVYLVCCLVPDVAKVIAIFHGEKGSSKSTTMRLIRKLIDPSVEELLNLSSDQKSLVLALNNNYMPAFDNLDAIKNWQSDILCRACSGGAFTFRKLYSDADEVVLKIKRCIMLNGINLVAERSDLIDRSITFELDRISEEQRREESELYAEFESAKPYILADMFEILSKAMKIYPEVKLQAKSRMADWLHWACAVAEVMGIGSDNLIMYYNNNRVKGNDQVISTNPLAAAVLASMQFREEWRGTISEFHSEIGKTAELEHIDIYNNHDWPKSPNKLGAKLKLVKSNLLEAGIDFTIKKETSGSNKNRMTITVNKIGQEVSDSADIVIGDSKNLKSGVVEHSIEGTIIASQQITEDEFSFEDIP